MAARMANRNKAEKEVNEALARIQKSLGVEDGGFASVYFTGDNGEKLDAAIELIAEYIEAEVGFQLG